MDASMPSALVLAIVFALVALYALYFVIRAAVRDGIWLARAKETAKDPPERSRAACEDAG